MAVATYCACSALDPHARPVPTATSRRAKKKERKTRPAPPRAARVAAVPRTYLTQASLEKDSCPTRHCSTESHVTGPAPNMIALRERRCDANTVGHTQLSTTACVWVGACGCVPAGVRSVGRCPSVRPCAERARRAWSCFWLVGWSSSPSALVCASFRGLFACVVCAFDT